MAGQAINFGPIQSFKAGAAITANRAVKLDTTAGQVIHTTAITDVPIGVAQSTVASGEDVDVIVMSGAKVKMVASAAISLGAQLMCTGSGAGKVSTAAGATAYSVGQALSAAGADGEVIEAIFRPSLAGPANS